MGDEVIGVRSYMAFEYRNRGFVALHFHQRISDCVCIEVEEQANGQGRRRLVLRYYSIFNTEQCELPATITNKLTLPENRQLDPIEACEKILAGMPNSPE